MKVFSRFTFQQINLVLVALVLSSSCSLSTEEETPGSSMLWKIERDDLKHPTYMLGTMHIIGKEYFHFPEKLEKMVIDSKQLIMELDGMPNPAEAAELMKLPDSVRLNDFFTPEKMEMLYGFASKELKMNKAAFDLTFGKMKPFILLQLITQQMFEGETESYEMTLMGLASENKIKTLGLETVEQQIGFFDAIPPDSLAKIIITYFEDANLMQEQTKQMQQIYRRGNLDSLAQFMVESSPELMDYEKILLTDRNVAWVPKIIEYIFQKPSFIAVGAAHLAGKQGLIELLRKEGFTVTPVAF